MDDREWEAMRPLSQVFPRGSTVTGRVVSHHRFGFFVDLGDSVTGLVEIPFVRDGDGAESEADFPPIGSSVRAVVLVTHDHQQQVRLSIRLSDMTTLVRVSRHSRRTDVPITGGSVRQHVRMSASAAQADAFYMEALRDGRVWGIKDAAGFPAPKGADGVRAMPFWSLRSRAERVIETVPAYARVQAGRDLPRRLAVELAA